MGNHDLRKYDYCIHVGKLFQALRDSGIPVNQEINLIIQEQPHVFFPTGSKASEGDDHVCGECYWWKKPIKAGEYLPCIINPCGGARAPDAPACKKFSLETRCENG